MLTYLKKSKKKASFSDIFFYIFLGGLVLTVTGFLIASNLKINKKRGELLAQISYLKREIQLLEEKNQNLKTRILEKETESYLEKEARDRLGLKKPGEKVIVVLPPEKTEKNDIEKEKDFLQKLLEKFKFFR